MDYKKVIEAYNSGLIDKNVWQLTMDNDGGYWEYIGDLGYECDECGECQECKDLDIAKTSMNVTYGKPGGYGDIVDVLVAAGVNAEWC